VSRLALNGKSHKKGAAMIVRVTSSSPRSSTTATSLTTPIASSPPVASATVTRRPGPARVFVKSEVWVLSATLSWGEVSLGLTEKGLCCLTFPGESVWSSPAAGGDTFLVAWIKKKYGRDARTLPAPPDGSVVAAWSREILRQLEDYLAGHRRRFEVPLDLSAGTPFQQTVWNALQAIPYGETRSYRDLAVAIGRSKAARAVGQAVGANPVPIIVPCHRVISADGSLGGFGGGISLKKKLLSLEGVK